MPIRLDALLSNELVCATILKHLGARSLAAAARACVSCHGLCTEPLAELRCELLSAAGAGDLPRLRALVETRGCPVDNVALLALFSIEDREHFESACYALHREGLFEREVSSEFGNDDDGEDEDNANYSPKEDEDNVCSRLEALCFAAGSSGNPAIVRFAIDILCLDFDDDPDWANPYLKESLAEGAALVGSVECLRTVLEESYLLLDHDWQGDYAPLGDTLLAEALAEGHFALAEWLLSLDHTRRRTCWTVDWKQVLRCCSMMPLQPEDRWRPAARWAVSKGCPVDVLVGTALGSFVGSPSLRNK
jgi:hypothetical protein